MKFSFFSYFTDPLLRGPTIGSMFMCLAAALVGVIVFLRRQSLLGETLSHAAYPGVILGVIFSGVFGLDETNEGLVAAFIITGAFTTSLLGLWTVGFLERFFRISPDSALCFVLSAFFGVGLTIASQVQFSFTSLYRQMQTYLYGQAATMTDTHIMIYGGLSFFVVLMILLFYKELQVITFNREYAKSIGINTKVVDGFLFILIVLAVVIGIRSVGVVLMSAMLIAPAAAARQYSHKLYMLFFLAALFGMVSGFFGNYFSTIISMYLLSEYPDTRLSLPTGPMIVIVASVICILSLFFAPERGLLLRLIRIARFRFRCICESILKIMWRYNTETISFEDIKKYQSGSSIYLRIALKNLTINGWIVKIRPNCYVLTDDGKQWAAQIVRLHRLWEVYLVEYLGMGAERVHRNAEEMQHIITPEIEKELTLLLKDPKVDPHHQAIPPKEGL